MAFVSGGKSTLNPNAPLFVPAAVRRVEDFSPEWYDLVSTSTWFCDYWLSQHQEADMFCNPEEGSHANADIVDLLPDEIDVGVEEEFSYMESQFQGFAQSSHNQQHMLNQVDGSANNFGLSETSFTAGFSLSETSFPAGSKFAGLPIKGK